MPSILIVEKNGTIKSLNAKNASFEELYKKAGFKSNTDFELQTTWNVDLHGKHYCISLYGKKNGRANQENKYEFPPPVDSVLYFGNCLLVNHDKDVCTDLSVEAWEKVYEHLYGGFEDLDNSSDTESSSEDADGLPKTKSGYVKDDFIVDDDEASTEYEDDDSVSDTPPPPKKSRAKKTTGKQVTAPKKSAAAPQQQPVENGSTETAEYLGCTSELSEEEYV